MKRFPAGLAVIFFLVLTPAFAEYNPPDGGEALYEFASPLFLAGGTSTVSQESPEADILNPAASALQQRTTLGLSYTGLADFDEDGWKGHGAFAGGTFPTRYGVFSGSLQMLTSALDDMDLGTLGIMRFSFAKDLFPNLLVGSGLHVTVGEKDSFDIGIGADLGFIHLADGAFGLRNFRWGAAVRNMGKWYEPVDGRSAFPSPFTPAVGAGFTALRTAGGVSLDLTGDAAFPSFQNLRLTLGADLSIKERFSLQSALHFDVRQFFDDDLSDRSLIPSFGITAVFKTDFTGGGGFLDEKGWNRSDARVRLAAAPLHRGIWASGGGVTVNLGVVDRDPPKIRIVYPGEVSISPNLDGKSDALEFPVSLEDERYIREHRFIVKNEAGETVRVIENKERRPENETVRSVIDRLLSVKSGIEVPKTFRWDGIGDSGAVVPDGAYTFVVEAGDDNGNQAVTPPRRFIVDSTAPAVDIAVPRGSDLIFSPNDDGSKDTLRIVQKGSAEDAWKAEIVDAAGKVVRTFAWENGAPATIEWDGKDGSGILLPDGIYAYRIASRDRAGNDTEAGFGNIFINTETTPISLKIDASYFSPDGDGIKDTVTLTPVVPVTNGLESWELLVVDGRGAAMRRYSGNLNAPLPVVFDGRMEAGTVLPEGGYTARLRIVYRNGNRPAAESPQFTVDLTKPRASLRADLPIFSPNGDGSKDEITFFQETTAEESWTGTVRGRENRVVKTFAWIEKADAAAVWNGTGDAGTLVPDGTYTYRLESVDRAGNRGVSDEVSFTINTEETPVILSADIDAFSPNGDGIRDVVRFTPTVKVREGVETVALTVRSGDDAAVRVVSGRGRLEPDYVWDGSTGDGSRAPDGMYTAEIVVVYRNGNRSVSRTGPVELDTGAPRISVRADRLVFSPDGDGSRDLVTAAQTSSRENLWEGKVTDGSGKTVRNYFWKGEAGEFSWDGADGMGNRVPDGVYLYTVRSEDRAGNSAQAVLRGIRVDTRPASAFVTVDAPGFSPNGDGAHDETEFTVYLNMTDGIESWRLRVVDAAGAPKKLFQGKDLKSPMKIRWDGRAEDGSVTEGLYAAEFEAAFEKGNRPAARTGRFLLDVSPPEVKIGLEPLPFSPDNDGVADELVISLAVKDASAVAGWNLGVTDRNGSPFNRFSGTGLPAETIRWDGRSSTGELVIAAEDYPYAFTISDALGNSREVKGFIPIDILVIRDGDRLKIKISSITFAPNSPQVVLDDTETGVKNRSVLKRLVEVLTKYGNYQIRIEGHANNISGTAREENEELGPLSLARAEEVRKALVDRGLGARRIDVEGKGGREMIFPFGDRENNWKNRRVEFILVK